ncbi:MAG TPA: non-homologous end-joining DNA ligase [Dehalococcoidia bacterium]
MARGVTRSGRGEVLEVGGRQVRLTNWDKVYWPDEGITKGDLVRYYLELAETVLPHVAGRPLTLHSFPDGIHGPDFYRRQVPKNAPPWLRRWRYRPAESEREVTETPVVEDAAGLVWLVQTGTVELHPWTCRIDRIDRPDYAVFDLDTWDADAFDRVLRTAVRLREALSRLGVRGYPKTSGGDGLHVFVPLERRYTHDQVREWVKAVGERLERAYPGEVTVRSGRDAPREAVFLDYAQNAIAKSTAAAYSVRPRPGAPVSMPLAWEEVEAGRVRPGDFTLRNAVERVRRRGDLFRPVLEDRQRLPLKAL